jgi:Cdc6-like AAA superfamily ATPase
MNNQGRMDNMKINKNLVENKIITEAEEEVVTTVEPITPSDSVDVVADGVKDQVVAATDGEEVISDENAVKVAAEIKQTADEVDAGAAIISNGEEEPLGVKNAITDTLDAALNASLRNKRRGIKSGNNVLIVGLPGSGKTATVYDWAKARGNVNLVYINAKNNDLEAYINGYTVRDAENPNKVKQAYSDNLAALEEPNSVLFLDEYNRQIKPNIRASLYTLINEHKISGEGQNKTH